jgi:quercetin dioxygenase-like cupin family protein
VFGEENAAGVFGPKSAGTPLHINTLEDENYYVVNGTLTFQVGEQTIEAPTGSFVRIPRGVVHTHWNATDAPVNSWGFPLLPASRRSSASSPS